MLNRNAAPEFKEISKVEIVQAETTSLDNGIPLHILKAGTEPVVRLEFIFKAGHWYEPSNGISYFTTKLLSAGTSDLSSKQIEEQIAQYGAFLDLITGYDRCTVTIYSLSRHLAKILPLVYKMVTDSVFPIQELENLKTITSQNLKVNLKKTSFLASKNYRELLFGKNHPYGRTIDESALSVEHSELLKYYKEKFSYKNCDILISGNGDENFFELINQHFGADKWGSSQSSNPNHPMDVQPLHPSLLIKNPESVQSSIRMGLKLFPINHPDYFILNLLIEIYGGYFSSRLMKNIREEKGYTYGINASFNSLGNSGYMVIGTDVNKENTSNTIREILKEMNILKTEKVSAEELTTVVNYLKGSFISSLSTPFGLADKFKTIYFHDLTYGFYNQYLDFLKQVTPTQILEAANTYFKEEKILEVVVGDKA
jgi:zinc protease